MPKGQNVVEMTGKVFGRLTALERTGSDQFGNAVWRFRCDCGIDLLVPGAAVRRGNTTSCGCRSIEVSRQNVVKAIRTRTTHAASYTRLYGTWASMRGRCQNEKHPQFANYGGRGIRVCERWNNFSMFAKDMGAKPSPSHSIDRIDVDGDYSPENCRWATLAQQNNNKRTNVMVDVDGVQHTLTEAARARGLNPRTVRVRVFRGWSLERALA